MMILITADFCLTERGGERCPEGFEKRKDMRNRRRREHRREELLKDRVRGEARSMLSSEFVLLFQHR